MVLSEEDSKARLPRFQPAVTWELCILRKVT